MTSAIIEELIRQARVAQTVAATYTQEQIDTLCYAIGWSMYKDENITRLAELAVEETGMGIVGDKIKKHRSKVMGVMNDIRGARTVGLIEVDEARNIRKYGKPVGVVAALCPVTNPTATPASNALSILKGGNAVIFSPHPRAKNATGLAVQFMRDALEAVGAPADLIQVIAEPSTDLTGELMAAVDLVMATGGAGMVKAAYSSGTPAYGVGPGNSCQIIAEDADIEDVADKLIMSKTFDNATSCSSENSIIVHESVFEELMSALKERGSVMLDEDERSALEQVLWVANKKGKMALNGRLICKSAEEIAAAAALDVPQDTVMIMVEGKGDIETDRFSGEKISPVLTVYKYSGFDEGLEILTRLTDHTGTGHSSGIHTFNEDYIDKLARHMRSSRILIRQPQAQGNGGSFFNGMPSTTSLGCGTWGGNITTENIHYKHFINVTWLSLPIDRAYPTKDEMWGEFLQEHGDL